MTSNIKIDQIGSAELDELVSISQKTFYDSFISENTEENMQQYIHSSLSKEKLAKELIDPNSAFYFAKMNGQVVGYIKINYDRAQTVSLDDKGIEVERIYVVKAFQGKNIGKLLLDHALRIAKERSAAYLWLAVWEKNAGAIRFYERNGLEKFGSHPFVLGEDIQNDIMMKIELGEGSHTVKIHKKIDHG